MKQIPRNIFQIFAILLCTIFWLSHTSNIAYASEVKTTAEIEYRYFSMEDLTEEEKEVLHYTTLPQKVEGDMVYYLAYSPIGLELPKTGDAAISLYGGILCFILFILGLMLYKKNVRIRACLSIALAVLLFSETIFMHQGLAAEYTRFKTENQKFTLNIGDDLPAPKEIAKHVYRAYISFEELTKVLPDKAASFGTNGPRATQLPVIDTKEAEGVIKSSTGMTERVSAGSGGSSQSSSKSNGESKGTPSDGEMKDKIVIRIVEEEEIIDYRNLSPEYEVDEDLGAGERRVVEGRNGSIIKEIEVTSINGVDVAAKVIRTRTVPARATKIYIGRSNPATPSVPAGGGEEVPGENPDTGGEEPVQTRRVTERTAIPFDTDYINDPSLAYGEEEVDSDGVEGILVSIYEETYRGEELLSRLLISSDVEQRPTNKVVRRGTLLNEPPVITLTRFVKDSLANKVVLTYHLEDADDSLVEAEALLYKHRHGEEETLVDTFDLEFDEDGNKVLTIDDLVNNLDYVVKVRLKYNNRQEEITVDDLLEKDFVLGKKVEIKNITSLQLFDENNTEVDINGIETLPTNFTSYSLKINVEDGKNIILPVIEMTEAEKDGSAVYKVVVETAQLVQDIGVNFYENAIFYLPKIMPTADAYYSFAELIAAMQNDPTGTFVLGANLDASSYPVPGTSNFAYITQEFTGTLIGERNGVKYAINGLQAPLFKTTRNATIKSLDLKNVDIKTTAVDIAPLICDALGTTLITDVAVSGSVQTQRYMAGIVNKLKDNSVMRDVSFSGSLVSTRDDDNAIGGAVGRSTGSSVIERANIHADITVRTTRTIGNIGGIVGNMRDSSKLYRSYVEGMIYNSGNTTGSVGGAVGLATQNPLANEVVVAVDVTNGYKTYGGDAASATRLSGIYYVDTKSAGEEDRQSPASILLSVEDAKVKVESYNLTATINDSDFDYNIPKTDYSTALGYVAEKEAIYRNMEKLIPFYDKQIIVEAGNKVEDYSHLATKKILTVTPMQDNTIFYDLATNKENLNKIIIVYTDNTSEVLEVVYKGRFADTRIEEYTITGTDLIYTPEIFSYEYGTELDNLINSLSSLNYKDTLFGLYPDFEYSFAQKVGYTYALGLAYNVGANQTTAGERLKADKVDPYSLEKSFENVKTDLRKYIIALLESGSIDDTRKFNPSERMAYIEANKEKIMFGLAYIDRWYNFKVGGVDGREITAYRQNIFGKDIDMIQNIIDMADVANPMTDNSRKALLFGEHSHTAYANVFGQKNSKPDISSYLSSLVTIFEPGTTVQDWYISATKALVKEVALQDNGENLGVYRLWDNLQKNSNKNLILPILSMPSMGLAIISNNTVLSFISFENYYDLAEGEKYEDKPEVIAGMERRLEEGAEYIRLNFEFWYRMANENVKGRLLNAGNIPLLTWNGYNANGKWMIPFSREEAANPNETNYKYGGPSVAEFFTPIGKYYATNGLGAYANGSIIHFVVYTLLNKGGGSVLSHEATHNLDGNVYLGGYGRRDGMGAEDFATGMWHSVDNIADESFGMNTYIDYNVYNNGTELGNRLHNASPERFQSQEDLKEYWERSMDVLYTLYYAEGEEILALSDADKKYMLEKVEWDATTRQETFRNITQTEVEDMHLTTVDDLIDNSLLVYPYGGFAPGHSNVGTIGVNTYYTENRFFSLFGTYTAPTSVVGSRTFKGMSFEMMAAGGYEGYLNYTSNKLRAEAASDGETFGDAYILKKTFNNTYQTMNEFRKAMFAQRYAKKDLIKPFEYRGQTYTTYEDMRTLLREAVARDLQKAKTPKYLTTGGTAYDYNYTYTKEVKREIFKYYLQSTNDFRESIYR